MAAKRTLFSRLVTIISGLTFSIVLLFTAATLLITYSFEDVLFNERMEQAHVKFKNGESLPYNIRVIDKLDELEPNIIQKLRYFEVGQGDIYGEFNLDQRHYHYLITEHGTILYDTTDVALVDRALEDVFLILGVLLIPTVVLTFWVAKLSARYALKPFTQLSEVFTKDQEFTAAESKQLDAIKEQDVRLIAMELQDALQQKAQLLEQQVTFNQGLAHELRTPLQVMRNSVELMRASHQEMADSAAFRRLEKSMTRMRRLSNGLLWLTSNQVFNGSTEVQATIQSTLLQLEEQCSVHGVCVELNFDKAHMVAMPEEVLELIVFNLFNNVVHHGREVDAKIEWSISTQGNLLRFSNLASNMPKEEQHFGIGLSLVSRLTERFGYTITHLHTRDQFCVSMSLH